MDQSYRQAMMWFILSEVMFFAAFFGALFYARLISVPWLAGAGDKLETHLFLWPDFAETWPLFMTPGGTATEAMAAWGLPFINTVILVTSSVTVTFAHWALKKNQRGALQAWLGLTVALGFVFLVLQGVEYVHAYSDLGLNLSAGNLRLNLLHADRIPRRPRHPGRDDAGRHAAPNIPGGTSHRKTTLHSKRPVGTGTLLMWSGCFSLRSFTGSRLRGGRIE